jgi:DNA-binding NarL/FixJ family response regulator
VDPEDSDGLTAEGITAMGLLTEAENEVTQLLVRGASTKEIAERRQVAEETVRRQIKSVLSKLNCRSRSDVIRLALATRLPLAK